ncbi:MAG: phosphoenolpyruvate carboxykinase (GTP), partial [Clostridia bacterium]|nr:phosphoenolpyruvate carboxykinase (GTP) [Clostridia bacterium]
QHWIDMGEKLGDKAPKIFHVNWFRTDEEGHFIWPGFGDNLRVLDWMLKRCEGTVDAQETAIGYVPNVDDINLDGLDFSKEDLVGILNVDKDLWRAEVPGIKEFYAKFGDKLPATLQAELDTLESKLGE